MISELHLPVQTLRTEEIARLRQTLLWEKEMVAARYQEKVRAAREIHEEGTEDLEELAAMDVDRDLLLALSETDREHVAEIEEALRRMDEGTYGICEYTGEPMPLERLRQVPWARYCAEHQKQYEEGLLFVM